MSQILVEHDPSPMKLEVLYVDCWPVKEAPGSYHRKTELCETSYIVEGEAQISTSDEPPVKVIAGDLVTIMPDTDCVWHITREIERHYTNR